MSGEEAGQPQRYCGGCGTENKPGNAFCTSCGASLPTGNEDPEQTHAEASPEGVPVEGRGGEDGVGLPEAGRERGTRTSPVSAFKEVIAGCAAWFSGWFKRKIAEGDVRPEESNRECAGGGPAEAGLGDMLPGMPRRAVRWFGNLPVVSKAAILGLGALTLLVLLAPLIYLVARLALVASIIALIVQAVRRRSIRGWGMTAVASLVLMLGAGIASNLVYNTNYLGGVGYELSAEEQDYVREVKRIRGEISSLSADQERLMEAYPRISQRDVQEADMNGVSADAQFLAAKDSIRVPEGCEDHHEVFVEAITSSAASIQFAGRYLAGEGRKNQSDSHLADTRASQNSGKANRIFKDIEKRGCNR